MSHPTVPATHVDLRLIDPNNHSSERYKFLSDNCIKLAEFLTDLPARFHHQGSWASPSRNACGTTGCALGWAAMAHVCDGLQFRGTKVGKEWIGVDPAINGTPSDWSQASSFFLDYLVDNENVFGPHGSKVEVINKLYRIARRNCAKAKLAKKREEKEAKKAVA